jgi:hypothetical protein|tara:strand:- start:1297 stop:1614 length:318 start_codon:yes stop_codon:yes gene_type:complete
MARFELILSIAKRKNDNELYTENKEYMCYCKDLGNIEEITETVNEIVYEEFEENEKDEVLFGSADVIINKLTVMMMHYKNSDLPKKEVEDIIDLLMEGSREETMH